MINSSYYDNTLSVKNILKRTTPAEIFRHFLGFDYVLTEFYKSPLREDDHDPSFNVYVSSNGILMFKDWGGESGDCFAFVEKLWRTDFQGALSLINSHMNLGLFGNTGVRVKYEEYKTLDIQTRRTFVRARLRSWNQGDANYWKTMYITPDLLELYDVYPGAEVWKRKEGYSWKRSWLYTKSNPIYIYKMNEYHLEDGVITFSNPAVKGYRPFQIEALGRNPKFKWLSGCTGNYVQGLQQLIENPLDSRILFITSSLKDVMVLRSIGINAIAPNSEGVIRDDALMEYLKERFDIYVNYDNDDPGVRASQLFTEEYGLGYWNIPKEFEEKDVSDFVKRYGKEKLLEIISNRIAL